MKIVTGITISSYWGNGHATLGRGLWVTFFERDVPYYASSRDLAEFSDLGELILYSDWQDVVGRARRQADSADAVMITSCCPDAIAASEMVLNSRAALRVSYGLVVWTERGRVDEYIGNLFNEWVGRGGKA